MFPLDYKLLKLIGILLLSGGIIFWIGAFWPPSKQWLTNDTREYLLIINSFRTNWYIIHGLFLAGIVASLFGVQLFSSLLLPLSKRPVLLIVANTSFLIGSIFWILNISFRLTATVWAAGQLAGTGQQPDWFQTWMDWSNMIFAAFMLLSYFAIGCLGYALLYSGLTPIRVSWFCTVFGFAGTVLYLFRFPLFAPPLMVYLPIIILGFTAILKKS